MALFIDFVMLEDFWVTHLNYRYFNYGKKNIAKRDLQTTPKHSFHNHVLMGISVYLNIGILHVISDKDHLKFKVISSTF
jgi:hypothetical protein